MNDDIKALKVLRKEHTHSIKMLFDDCPRYYRLNDKDCGEPHNENDCRECWETALDEIEES